MQWLDQQQFIGDFYRRMRIFHGPRWTLPRSHPTITAATYPQVVSLARLIGSPHWRAHVLAGAAELDRFFDEVRRTVAPDYGLDSTDWRFVRDPLVDWIKNTKALGTGISWSLKSNRFRGLAS